MKRFNVWISRMDGVSRLRVDGRENAHWLIRRLSDCFVFKTSEPLHDLPNSSDCTFRIANSSQLSASQFEKLLAGLAEVTLRLEPAPSTPEANEWLPSRKL
jgi:hypothetical protein